MKVQVPIRLAKVRQLAAVDVESAYRALVQAIGGTYYTNGVATANAPGQLDARNFHAGAGIRTGNRANPTSIWALSQVIPTGASAYYEVPPSPFLSETTLFAWCGACVTAGSLAATTLQLQILPSATVVDTWNMPAGPPAGFLFNRAVNYVLKPGDFGFVTEAPVGGAGPGDFVVTLWFKSTHVRA